MNKYIFYIIVVFVFKWHGNLLCAQTNNDCLKEIATLEEKINVAKDSSLINNTIALSYSVRVTNWEDEVTVSNIKVYKKDTYMHFFTEQANIYQDANEVVMILPIQKMAIISSTSKDITKNKLGDAFYEMKKQFMDSCEVVRCEMVGSKKILELKVVKPQYNVNIINMVYEYDVAQGKILTVKVNYNEDYKIKQMITTYKDFNTNSTYQFASARKYIADKSGKPLAKLAGYEFVDNRDQKKGKKK